jgi:hypothetical protein
MWCAKCQADVSTEVSSNGQSVNCTNCGNEIRKTQAPSLHPEIHRARQLIEELSVEGADTEEKPYSGKSAARPQQTDSGSGRDRSTSKAPAKEGGTSPELVVSRSFRIDSPHRTERGAHTPPPNDTLNGGDSQPREPERRNDEPHLTVAAPHFDLAAMPQKLSAGKAESIWGQLLAYGGVAVLTVGTALVLWGHFGGPAQYAPTGWLVATAGQMLLFLGVVTLISGGMQQTTQQVTSRVEYIGNRMLRFEQTAEELLRGPHFGREGQTTKETASRADDAATS